jgi:hypothetical protein
MKNLLGTAIKMDEVKKLLIKEFNMVFHYKTDEGV